MHFGGGGGPSNKKDVLIVLSVYVAAIAGFMLFINKEIYGGFQMKVTQKNNYSAQIDIRKKSNPHIIKITNKNIECLKNKGYSVKEKLDTRALYVFWDNIAYLETVDTSNRYVPRAIELSKDTLIRDCKECNVHTEIIYEYDDLFGNEKQTKKKLYWHKCYVDELK